MAKGSATAMRRPCGTALDAKTWKEVAAACDASTSTVRRWYDISMDYIDAAGFDGAIAGEEV